MKKLIALLFVMVVIAATVLTSCTGDKKADAGKEGATSSATTATAPDANAASSTTAPAPDPDAPDPNLPKTTMEFKTLEHDFGKQKAGGKFTHDFEFKNTGKEPLIINNAKGSCGCTVPEWPKEPIAPGASGKIKVEFDSKGKSGPQTKTVTINANTDPNPTRLTIKAELEADPNAPPPPAAGGNAQPIEVKKVEKPK